MTDSSRPLLYGRLGMFLVAAAIAGLGVSFLSSTMTGMNASDRSSGIAVDRSTANVQSKTLAPALLADAKKFTHVFRIRNRHDKELILRSPSVSCGCSGAVLDKTRLSRGETAALTLKVDISRGYEGLKRVSAAVVAESGERWECRLEVPVAASVIVPSRIAIRPEAGSEGSGVSRETTFHVLVRTADREKHPLSFPEFSVRDEAIRLSLQSHTDSAIDVHNARYFQRDCEYKLELLSTLPRSQIVDWSIAGIERTTEVDVIAVLPVTFKPERIVIRDSSVDHIELTLTFSDARFTAKLIRFPDFLSPMPNNEHISIENPSQTFGIARSQAEKPVDDIVFQILEQGRPLGTVTATVVNLIPFVEKREFDEN